MARCKLLQPIQGLLGGELQPGEVLQGELADHLKNSFQLSHREKELDKTSKERELVEVMKTLSLPHLSLELGRVGHLQELLGPVLGGHGLGSGLIQNTSAINFTTGKKECPTYSQVAACEYVGHQRKGCGTM